ncbi:UTP--glucose-1-phosphate uridylyltransferase [Desulfoscipio geothermicus DSM 3669]|uniref:UTP--glucose-1-phosphate uridylyltransferase n=1 Tax=Desulfoscipio geothermicus DSM 3669 TaxID=1121426 RepID=A0A1I6EIH9_9FIRM|nr:UTP--glucose-1-phosphate uridylyltransferase [Desulfoscipio geothermicus DSM 3669]
MLQTVRQISIMADVQYIRQKELLGLGHAVLCARKFVGDEPFAVLLGDDVIQSEPPGLLQMINAYNQFQTSFEYLGLRWGELHRQSCCEATPK